MYKKLSVFATRFMVCRMLCASVFKEQKLNFALPSIRSRSPPVAKPRVSQALPFGLCKKGYLSIVCRRHFMDKIVPQVQCQIEFMLFVQRFKRGFQVCLANVFG